MVPTLQVDAVPSHVVQAATVAHDAFWPTIGRRLGSNAAPRLPSEVAHLGTAAWEDLRRSETRRWAEDILGAGGQLVPTGPPSEAGGVLAASVTPGGVLACGDWHRNLAWACMSIAVAAAAGATCIIQVGDFGVWPGARGQRYLDGIALAAEHHDVTVVMVDGNHEDFTQLARNPILANGWRPLRPRLLHAPRGHRWSWLGLRWAALGGATSLDRAARTIGVNWWPEEEISYGDLARLVDGGPVDVLVTHDAPTKARIPGLDPHAFPQVEIYRAAVHRRWIDEAVAATTPRLLLHGHFHRAHRDVVPLTDGRVCRTVGLDADGAGPQAWALITAP